jgi:hypothetical protein
MGAGQVRLAGGRRGGAGAEGIMATMNLASESSPCGGNAPASMTDAEAINAFVKLADPKLWAARLGEIGREVARSQRVGRALLQWHAIEITIERLRRAGGGLQRSPAERCVLDLLREALRAEAALGPAGRGRLRASLAASLHQERNLVPLFHLLRTAALQRSRGFAVRYAGFEDGAGFDLLLERNGAEAEVVCDVVSAEDGRDVHRGAWAQLIDRIDGDLQTWLSAHPGKYLLKLTLPQGLNAEESRLAALHGRISTMLREQRRADHDEACVLRLDPLILAAAQVENVPSQPRLISSLRRAFGPQAHLAVTAAGQGVFVLAARAAREDEVAVAIRRRLAAVAPARLSGARPGILAMFVEDTDRTEWRLLREQLELEGETRQFLTHPEARCVVAVTCASRHELFGAIAPDAASDGELRFRNPSHPAAKTAGLAPAVLSSL